jgi:uncharacterized protein (TIGR03086 family)
MKTGDEYRLPGMTDQPTTINLEPAAQRLADLVRGVPESALDGPTPCPEYTLGDLVDHVGGLALAFAAAATKARSDASSQGPSGDAARLGSDWQTRVPADLARLADAWSDASAWTGMTSAGGVDLPGEIAGLVALDELVIHGWDIARATGQVYECDQPSLEAVLQFVTPFSQPGQEAQREGLFGPVVPVSENAPLLDRVIGLTGRDPAWTA